MNHPRLVRAGLALLALLLVSLVVAPPAAAEDPEHLRVVHFDTSRRPQASVIVAVPERFRTKPLSAEAFTVLPRSESNRLDVRPVPASTLEVVLAFDPSASPAELRAAGRAASSLLPTLPAGAHVAVVWGQSGAGGSGKPKLDVPEAAAQALSDLDTQVGRPILDQLATAASTFSTRGSPRRVLVLFGSAGFTPSAGELAPLRAQVDAQGITVYPVRLRPPGQGDELSALAERSGGLALPVASVGALPDAYGSVLRDLLSQYRLSFRLPYAAPPNLRIDLATDAAAETVVVPIPNSPAADPARSRGLAGLVLSPLAGWLQLVPVVALIVFAARRERARAGGPPTRMSRLSHSAFPVLVALVLSVFALRLIAIGA